MNLGLESGTGLFWAEPEKRYGKSKSGNVVKPDPVWLRPDYLPYYKEACEFKIPLIQSFEEMLESAQLRDPYVYDAEVYPNYFLVAFKNLRTGKFTYVERITGVSELNVGMLEWIMQNLLLISFNGNHFDQYILHGAVDGMDNEQLTAITDDIIVKNMRGRDALAQYKIKPRIEMDHVDIKEVPPGVQISLKVYGGRVGSSKIQDLPYPPGSFLSQPQISVVRWYCCNDLALTEDLFKAIESAYKLRLSLNEQYGVDTRSRSDAQVAETVITHECMQELGVKRIQRPSIAPGTAYRYQFPPYIFFQTPELQAIADDVRRAIFYIDENGSVVMPRELDGRLVKIGHTTYKLGIGGLHSCESAAYHQAINGYRLFDMDVASYYPNIILNQRLSPAQFGQAFLPAYGSIVQRRLHAKAEVKRLKKELKPYKHMKLEDIPDLQQRSVVAAKRQEMEDMTTEMNSLKIVINGSFGKFGSKYSNLYAPQLMFQTTVSGQLMLLMLIEAAEMNGIQAVSANTDGVVFKPREDQVELLREIAKWWMATTSLELEETEYKGLYSANVNNYFAIKTDGSVKAKGIYAEGTLGKSLQSEVCSEAVKAYLANNVPFMTTIKSCTNLSKFLTLRKVAGGACKNGEFLGSTVRWYYGKGEEGPIVYANSGNSVPKSEGGKPCQILPDVFPDDIDYDWYENECYTVLQAVGVI